MAVLHTVDNFDDFIQLTTSLEAKPDPIYVLFTGSKNEQGKSWCPDCVKAHPFIEAAVKSDAPANCHFITVLLQRDFWKDQKCVFRTDSRLRLTCIPTLMRWPRSQEKLQEAECANPALLKLLFEADD